MQLPPPACVQLDPVPLHQLQRVDGSRWRATGHDPHFRVALPAHVMVGGLFRITADLEGGHLQRPCLYLDTGAGWSEAGRVDLQPEGPGCWSALAVLPPLAGDARFDPSECPGTFQLHALRVEPADAAVVVLERLAREAAEFPGTAARVLAHAGDLAATAGATATCAWLLGDGPSALRQPGAAYQDWIQAHDSLPGGAVPGLRKVVRDMRVRPLLSLVLPVPASMENLAGACIDSILAQLYPDWELLLVGGGDGTGPCSSPLIRSAIARSSRIRWIPGDPDDAAAWNRALEAATGGWLGLLQGMPVLAPHALLAYASHVAGQADLVLVYSDSDQVDASGQRHSPVFRPGWNPDLFLARDYIGGTALLDIGRVRAVGGFRPDHAPAIVGDLVLRCVGDGSPRVAHLPLVLSHWPDAARIDARALGDARRTALAAHLGDRAVSIEGAATDGARIHWPLPQPAPRVSIVVPTRDRVDLLRRCVESILGRSTWPDIELLVVDNGSVEGATLDYLADLESRPGVRVLRDDRPFNYSAINNAAVAQSSGELIALVNNDIEVLTPGWLEEMASQALRPGIGAVGAMLYYPDDTIQHAGVVVGLGGVAGHVYSRQPRGAEGEGGRAALVQELSAVTAACLVVSRAAWDAVGGLDEGLQVAFNDVDFCLRLREAGYRNLWTPHAEFYHHESASRGSEDTEDKLRRFHSEVDFMLGRWGRVLDDDPAYNPNLSLRHGAANELASPPRSGLRAWLRHVGLRSDAPSETTGCWTPR